MLPPADPFSLPAATTASAKVVVGRSLLRGYSFRETTGTTRAVVRLHDGETANGNFIGLVTLSPGESIRDWFGEAGINVDRGVFVELVSGTVDGVCFITPGEHIAGWGMVAEGPGW